MVIIVQTLLHYLNPKLLQPTATYAKQCMGSKLRAPNTRSLILQVKRINRVAGIFEATLGSCDRRAWFHRSGDPIAQWPNWPSG
jgi:hypothetical protein